MSSLPLINGIHSRRAFVTFDMATAHNTHSLYYCAPESMLEWFLGAVVSILLQWRNSAARSLFIATSIEVRHALNR